MKRGNLNKECFALQCSIDQGRIISAFFKRCLKVTKEFEFFLDYLGLRVLYDA